MTAEEAELTFIRCPSCRSLIPAIATRCRMCGHQFEKGGSATNAPAAGGASSDETQPAKSRVRQRTASTSPSEVEALRAQQASMGALDEPDPVLSKSPSWQQFVSDQSPLEDEEIDAENTNDLDSGSSDAAETSSGQSSWDDHDEAGDDDDFEGEGEAEGEGDAFGSSAEGGRQGKRRRRRRRKRKGNGLLQGEAGSSTPASGDKSESETTFSSPGKAGASDWNLSEGHGFQSPSFPTEAPLEQSWEPEGKEEPVVSVKPVASAESSAKRESMKRDEQAWTGSSLVAEQRVSGDGMLIGWLVSFREDNKGRAVEIRSGRCFIGRGQLRNTDVVFSHESISTPHGMLVASEGEGFSFQDLMSERGTYVLRSGGKGNDWSQVLNSTVLNHGDRVRFGDYEVVVVLLPR